MERSVDVDTGESVTFRYELAGLGSRFLAVLIDVLFQLAALIAIVVAVALIVRALGPAVNAIPFTRKGFANVVIGVIVLLIFLLFFGYFIVFEWLWNGKTPGKRVLGIRVVRDGGFPVDFVASAIRNIIRVLEAGLGFYLFSAVSALLSPLNRRLGDYAAGTIVVRDERYERTALLPGRADEDPVLRELGAPERDLIRRYAERRGGLSPVARLSVAAAIASEIRPRLAASFAHLDDDALLEHLAQKAAG
jgi:uncharacterized RDD family membrane protein YckC